MKTLFNTLRRRNINETAASHAGHLALSEMAVHLDESGGALLVDDSRLLFAQLAEKGFTTFVAAAGPWLENETRLVREQSAKHPDGSVVAVSVYKSYTDSGHTMRSAPQAAEYTAESYQAHAEQWQLTFGQEIALTEALQPTPEA